MSRITAIETAIPSGIMPNLLLVRIHTEDGFIGCGETYYTPHAIAALIHDWMAERLLGADALAIEAHWRFIYERCTPFGHPGAEMRALSAIDLALWDILGQACNQPVYRLLGGPVRDAIPVYNTSGGPSYGALAGANFVSSQSGIIFRGLMTGAGMPESEAFVNALAIFASTAIIPVLVISAFVFLGGHGRNLKNAVLAADLPEAFNREQKLTLLLTLLMMVLVLAAPLALLAFPDNATIKFINSKVDIGLIASVFSVIALLLKLGDERKAIASVPWATLIMICGVGMLITVAIKAGTIDALSSWIGGNIPPLMIPVAFGVVAALMSIFASTLGVVTPALFPMVLPLSASMSIDPMIIFIAIVVGAQATSISPFSSGGSLLLGSCTDDKVRSTLFSQLLLRAAPIGFVAAMLFNLALTFLF